VRVRVSGDKAVLTINGSGESDHNGVPRAEFEYPIPVEDANQILARLCRQPLIEKTRFPIAQDDNTWAVDKFEKENDGLVIAEWETSKGNGSPAHLPSWIGEEASNDDRNSNANLVEHPYSEWHPGSEKPDPKHHWKAGEGVADGVKRIVAEQLQLAIWELSARSGSHEGRRPRSAEVSEEAPFGNAPFSERLG
jgi:adenylate cyclase